jgi:hypothetical protein
LFDPERNVPPLETADGDPTPFKENIKPILFLPSVYLDPVDVLTIDPSLSAFRSSSILLVVMVSPSDILESGWFDTTPLTSPRTVTDQLSNTGILDEKPHFPKDGVEFETAFSSCDD